MITVVILSGVTFQAAGAESAEKLTNDEILKMDTLHYFHLTPDGTRLVYLITTGTDLTPPADNGTLRLLDTGTKKEITLSDPNESVSFWAVSPDGSRIAYTSMPCEGGASSLTVQDLSTLAKEKRSDIPEELLNGFAWLGADHIVFTGAAEGKLAEQLPGDVIIMDAIPDPVIIKSYAVQDGNVTPLTANDDVIYAYHPSPDGKYIVYKAAQYPESWLETPTFRYVMLETATGTEDEFMRLVEGYQDENEFAWSPDSSLVYIERMQNGGIHYPVRYTSDIVAYTPATKILEEVPMNWDRKMLKDLFNDDVEMTPFIGGVYALLADGTNPKLAKYIKTDSGWEMILLKGEDQGNIFALESTSDGSVIYYNYNTASIPPQIYAAEISGQNISNCERLTNLNEDILKKPLGSSEVIEWTGSLNETVQGVLRYPADYKPGIRYPLVFVIHGGPTYTDFDSWRDTWEFPYHLITDAGFITLSANYHGSSNYGFEFAKSIEGGHYTDISTEDFEKGIEYLAERGIIDEEKVGTTGWSNGGILTLAWITTYDGLNAAVAGAGMADQNSQFSNTNGAVMTKMYFDKTPFQDPEAYIPIMGAFHAENVTTPLLMLSGMEDNSVSPASALSTYRAYKEGSKAEVQMIRFKGEPHHLKKYPNQIRKVNEEIGWLKKYILES
ncbi:MAG: prolyl oligopeptidase family serine peptidase [Euryarchaeota archaeon]|nr:prolyl oligopeptidase family serine peptidase [Euryarchaeota archaeon]